MATTAWYKKQKEHESCKETIAFLLKRKPIVVTNNISKLTTKIVLPSLESLKASNATQQVQDRFHKASTPQAGSDTIASRTLDPSVSLVSTSTRSISPSKLSWAHQSNASDFRRGWKQVGRIGPLPRFSEKEGKIVENPRHGEINLLKPPQGEILLVQNGPGEATSKLPMRYVTDLGREWLLEERKKIADEEDAVLQRRMKAYEALQQKE